MHLAKNLTVCNPRYAGSFGSQSPFLGQGILNSYCGQYAEILADCLAKNSYQQEKCQKQVDELYKCCNAFYARQGDDASTVSCPKAGLLRLKMKQRSQGL